MNKNNPLTKKQNRISRNIRKQICKIKRTKTYRSYRKAFLVSDSKGKDLKFVKGQKFIRFFYKGGAEITDNDIQSYAKHQVNSPLNKYPVLLFWFGTCSFTEKKDNLFVIKENLDQVIVDVIESYKYTKRNLLTQNPRAKICFLECPYYSLWIFNKHRGKEVHKTFFIEQQRELIRAIDTHNIQVRLLNKAENKTPNFNKDFTTRSHRRKRKPRYIVDYSQLRDGCHVGPNLSELWLLRIHRLIYRI